MASYHQGTYEPKNREKYIGKYPLYYRSSWELTYFQVLDSNPAVIQWASESIKIPYLHPFTGKYANYIPDLLIIYLNKDLQQIAELIEIKPLRETLQEYAKTKNDLINLTINKVKWQAAQEFCQMKGLKFRVMTEEQLFGSKNKPKKSTPKNRRTRKKK
jgi:hypothetical protein